MVLLIKDCVYSPMLHPKVPLQSTKAKEERRRETESQTNDEGYNRPLNMIMASTSFAKDLAS